MSSVIDDQQLHRLLYVSRISASLRNSFEQQLNAIVAQSEIDNRKKGVTGVLISHDGWFIQALEGRRQVVVDLYEHIARDPRHEAMTLVSIEAVDRRLFGAWAMRSGQPPSDDAQCALNMNTLSASVLLTLLEGSVGRGDVAQQLGELGSQAFLDSMPEQQMEDLVLIATAVARTPFGAIAMFASSDKGRSRFIAKAGLGRVGAEGSSPFLPYTIDGSRVLWIDDATRDPRFSGHLVVCQAEGVRFYAGVALIVGRRHVGSLFVLDAEPKPYDAMVASGLEALGRCVVARLEAQREEKMAASLLSTAADAIICLDEEGRIGFWNPSAERMFGYTATEALGQAMDIIVPERRRALYNATFDYAKSEGRSPLAGQSIEVPALRKDGTEFAIDVAIAVWGDAGQIGAGVIIRDCSERKAAQIALATAKTAAETANVAKSAFLANMSHEIRTPLNGVIGVVELLAASGLNAQQAEMAELIRSSGEQLHGLLGDILDIARIEAGQLTLTNEPVFLHPLLKSTIQLADLKAREKNISLNLQIGIGTHTPVSADPVRLKQILINLISNAVKFTDAGTVTMSVERRPDGHFEFCVIDSGVGFDTEQKEKIFGRFQQADGSITRRFGGTGLGLAICRQLTELMGGRIECESSIGEGSTFRVILPLVPVAAPDAADNEELPASCEPPEDRLSVLLADDHPTNRRVVELILASFNAQIVSVEDGAEALDTFKSQRFDLVLMDMMMPVMDGLESTRGIRDYETCTGLPRTPVIMLTANALPEHIADALACGADRHVSKPITAKELIAAISEEMARSDPETLSDRVIRSA